MSTLKQSLVVIHCLTLYLSYNVQVFGNPTFCGGNIGYEYIGGLTYNISGTVWVCDSADTLNAEVYFGDGSSQLISVPIEMVFEGVYAAYFSLEHTYPSAGDHDLIIQQFFLPNELCNVPNSSGQQLILHSKLVITPFFGANNTPVLSPLWQFQFEDGWLEHDIGAFDLDGDSLTYILVSPSSISGFSYPSNLEVTGNGVIRYLPETECGLLVFVQINEWRDGLVIQSVTRAITLDASLVGVNEIKTNTSLRVSPNPTSAITTLTWQGQLQGNYELEMCDVRGSEVTPPSHPKGKGKLEIDMSGLAKGIYFGRLLVGEEMRSFKVVRE